MKERLTQLKSRWQAYSPREKNLCKLCAGALCCAMIYYGVITPLDNMIKNSERVLFKQNQTLGWMREEINKNHLQAKVLTTGSPRNVIEENAKTIHLSLSEIRQEGQSLSFNVARINIYTLKNWLRELNIASGIHLQKIDLTPVDHLSDVKAQVTLSWAKVS